MKPKQNQQGSTKKSNNYDRCQTPFYALDPLLPYLPSGIIWEPAAGDGHIVTKLTMSGYKDIISGDILTGENFFETKPLDWDCQVTNPPYSVKYEWLARSYELGKLFALLMPLETLGASKGQRLFERYGVELILFDKRINFKMPNKGYGNSGAQFPTAWFTFGLGIGCQLTFTKVNRYKDGQLSFLPTPDRNGVVKQTKLPLIDDA